MRRLTERRACAAGQSTPGFSPGDLATVLVVGHGIAASEKMPKSEFKIRERVARVVFNEQKNSDSVARN